MKFITMDIECLEDIKVTKSLNQVSTNEALSYISGSSIRGAFISNYIRLKGQVDINKSDEGKSWFFNNGLEFFNGYIKNNGDRCYPIPHGLYADSTEIQDYHNNSKVGVKNIIQEKIEDSDKKFQPCEFISINSEDSLSELEGVNVKKIFNLHIRKDTEKGMFRYEAIEKGQIFKSAIKVNLPEDEIEKVIKVLNNGEFYIGGSKGSGYGKVKITNIKEYDENPEIIDTVEKIKNKFIIYTTSDGIYLNDSGIVLNSIDEKWLKEKLNINEIKLLSAATEETLIGGYNNKWGVRIPQYNGVKKGSIYLYEFEGDIDKDLLINIQNEGYGLRKEEGFGRFVILPSLDILSINKNQEGKVKMGKKSKIDFTQEEKEQINLIVNSLARKTIQREMKQTIVKNYSADRSVNNNQIGKLIQLFSHCQSLGRYEGIEYISEYLKHLSDNGSKTRLNQDALNQLKDLEIKKKNGYDFIMEESKKLYEVDKITIGGEKSTFTDQELYVYKMIELENMFRYILRSRDVK